MLAFLLLEKKILDRIENEPFIRTISVFTRYLKNLRREHLFQSFTPSNIDLLTCAQKENFTMTIVFHLTGEPETV